MSTWEPQPIFQSTLPRRERPEYLFYYRAFTGISIHAPTKGATSPASKKRFIIILFQSTLPRRERLLAAQFHKTFHEFQSTLPRRERLNQVPYYRPYEHISIHAPTKGATTLSTVRCGNSPYFNPRSHEGSDKRPTHHVSLTDGISIHAPTKGATKPADIPDNFIVISIHAPTKGATCGLVSSTRSSIFQSTLPRRERLRQSYMGIDASKISIHAPTKGATHSSKFRSALHSHFNPRSHEGSDICAPSPPL